MAIVWNDGTQSNYTFLQLRRACPCATCRETHGGFQEVSPVMDDRYQLRLIPSESPSAGPKLVRADWVGNYALKLTWEDGHDTGIYRFDYLRGVAEESLGNSDASEP